jgi:2-polyprenyl-6-methoxyphenol hydroxylase-like FAD-dependent oxidoreductase
MSRILIVGGGIAGMSAAIRLGRAGHAIDLIDADPEWRAIGTGITITGPTFRAFRALGVEEEVRALGATNDRVRIFRPPDSYVAEIGPPKTEPPLPNNGGILRPVLHKILSDKTRSSGASVRLGVTVSDLTESGARVEVGFSDRSQSHYDLVVGADGAFSDLRSRVFPEIPEPEYTGQGCFRHLTTKPPEVDCLHMFVGGPVKTGVTPCSPHEMYLFCNAPMPGNPRWDPSEDWSVLKGLLEGFGGVVGQVREALSSASNIVYRPLENFLLPDPWYRGRVLMIGDAAHATTPHLAGGAMMAVEDALVLGELLEERPIEQALTAFMRRRFERCRLVVEHSAQLGRFEMDGTPVEVHAELQQSSWQAMAAPI